MTADAVVQWAMELEARGEAMMAEAHALILLARKLANEHKGKVQMPEGWEGNQ